MLVNLANLCRGLLYVLAADMCTARVRVRSVGVDVTIARGILMFIWGSAYRICVANFYVSSPLTCVFVLVGVRSVGVDVSIAQKVSYIVCCASHFPYTGGKLNTKVAPAFMRPRR